MPMLVEIVQENTVLNVVDVLLYDLFFEKGIAILFDIQLCPLFSLHWLKSGDQTYDGQQATSIANISSLFLSLSLSLSLCVCVRKKISLEKKVILTFIIRHKCKIDMENLSQNL